MKNILGGLNEEQIEAVLHKEGPCLVLAGAGSGKTRVLTNRVAYLVSEGVRPWEILAITFTNKAAQEMKERIISLLPDFSGQWIRTFHSASYQILRAEIEHLGYRRDFTILDETEQKAVLKECLREMKLSFELRPEQLAYYIKQAKNSLKDPLDYIKDLKISPAYKEAVLKGFKSYNLRLKEMNALDFEDLILFSLKLFRENEEVQGKYGQQFRYIMIDEFQDTNYPQFLWAQELAKSHRNIFVVGDPDQSIYSWRGAEPYNIQRFLSAYPEAKVIKLEKNYRSTKNILEAANAVIRHNKARQPKELYTDNPRGPKIVEFCGADHRDEAEYVAQAVNVLVQKYRYRFRDIAVFYRTHAQSRNFEEAFNRRFIPYRIVGGVKFYQRKEIKDILAYLKFLANPFDLISFRRIINTPRRGVGEVTISKIGEHARQKEISLLEAVEEIVNRKGAGAKIRKGLQDFLSIMRYLEQLVAEVTLSELLRETVKVTGYMEDLDLNDPLEAETRKENIKELFSLVVEYEKGGSKELVDFLSQVALLQESDDIDYSDAVLMMTYHSAKGLEFPVVFMTGMEEGLFPSYRAETPDEIEEERRLCYVGMTRAKQILLMTRALFRITYGVERSNMPSRFLLEVPRHLVAGGVSPLLPDEPVGLASTPSLPLKEGDRVRHKNFGEGTVLQVLDGDIALIDFDLLGEKLIKTDIAPMNIVEIGRKEDRYLC